MQGIKKIMLTAERLGNRPPDYEDLNTDVIVQFDNGERYFATFFSCKNLESMIRELMRSPDWAPGPGYKVLDIVVVRDFNNGDLTPVIESMLAEGDFQLVFKKI